MTMPRAMRFAITDRSRARLTRVSVTTRCPSRACSKALRYVSVRVASNIAPMLRKIVANVQPIEILKYLCNACVLLNAKLS